MTGFDGTPGAGEDDAVARAYSELIEDIATLLDVEAGLRDAIVAARHSDLVNDLHEVLNIDAGLEAIADTGETHSRSDIRPYDPEQDDKARGHGSADYGQLVMPFYLICDVSFSMHQEIPALNAGVKKLRQSIVSEPVLNDVAQICVMTFSTEAKVVVPLGPPSETEIPVLAAENLTDYGTAFRMLASTIDADRNRLREQGYRIYRPCAFFLTDGLPTDPDWHKTFVESLTYNPETGKGMRAYPIFVPFGFREAREEILRQLAYPPNRAKWYHAKGVAIEPALGGLLNVIKNSMVSSGLSAVTGQPNIILPDPDPETGISKHDSGYDENHAQ